MTDNLTLAVNAAMNQNAIARARMGMLNPYGLDDKRKCSAWQEYGFPDTITYEMLFGLYRRGGLGHGAVEKLVGTCWKTSPWVIEGDDQDESRPETAWEKSATQTLTARVWRAFADADRRRLVGRFAGLLLHINDGHQWSQPAAKGKSLVKVTPAWAGSLKPAKFDTDENSQTYGQPTEWWYAELGSNGTAGRRVRIHPDRVFILGDWRDDAIGWLEPAYNAFVSLEKVEGGSGESFLKNAARQLNINFDSEGVDFASLASMYGVKLEELREKFDEVAVEMNRGNDTVLVTQGATTTPLVSNVPDPRPTYDINLQTVSAALDIPSRVMVGNQQGERASTEDLRYFNARCQSRRQDLGFEIEDFVDHLTRIGVLKPIAEKAIMWDDLNEQTTTEKLESALKMSQINQTAIATGEAVFGSNEIRTAAGYDPDGAEPLGEDDDEDPDDGDEGKKPDPAQ
ncbi:anti-CBASS protein Acb1 family protein [Castellaniella sp.]|uniref:anti-CBASS protein Acb1 family protein n=1 Tax=Castellaniella sp. TaxID=1955812 RepID=UPI002AFEDAEB|nr:anti-CBASS Acb1 family protein [Castellaniella sp.]